MNNLIINIGLNVGNIEPKEQRELTINNLTNLFNQFMYNATINEKGEWAGNKERVVVALLDAGDFKVYAIKLILSWLCIELNQDAIAFKLNNEGHVVFNPLYLGKKFNFDEEMFINF